MVGLTDDPHINHHLLNPDMEEDLGMAMSMGRKSNSPVSILVDGALMSAVSRSENVIHGLIVKGVHGERKSVTSIMRLAIQRTSGTDTSAADVVLDMVAEADLEHIDGTESLYLSKFVM